MNSLVLNRLSSSEAERHAVNVRVGISKFSSSAKNMIIMEDGFDYKGGDLVCKRCGSKNISIKSGMMVDRAICNSCGNEDYI